MAGHTATALLLKLGKMAGNLNAGGGGGGRCRRISRAPTGGGVGDTEAMVVLGGFTGAGGKAIAEANGETTDARSHYNAQTCLLRPSNPNPHCPSPCHPAPNPHHKVLAPPLRLALVRSRAYGSRAYTARPALCVARRRQREQWPCGGDVVADLPLRWVGATTRRADDEAGGGAAGVPSRRPHPATRAGPAGAHPATHSRGMPYLPCLPSLTLLARIHAHLHP